MIRNPKQGYLHEKNNNYLSKLLLLIKIFNNLKYVNEKKIKKKLHFGKMIIIGLNVLLFSWNVIFIIGKFLYFMVY